MKFLKDLNEILTLRTESPKEAKNMMSHKFLD